MPANASVLRAPRTPLSVVEHAISTTKRNTGLSVEAQIWVGLKEAAKKASVDFGRGMYN